MSHFDCVECDKDAVGLLKTNGETLYLCRYHYRKAQAEYAAQIDEKRLLPT